MKQINIGMVVLAILLFACSKNKGQDSAPVPTPLPPRVPGLYVTAGTWTTNSPGFSIFPRYFKNGRDTIIRDSNGNQITGRFQIVSDTLYILGAVSSVPTLWKNGVVTPITNPPLFSTIVDFGVSGSDLYILYSEVGAGPNPPRSTKLWKNGQVTTLQVDGWTTPFRLIISGSDIYVFAYYGDLAASKIRVWKNGQLSNITSASNNRIVPTNAAVNNGDVYVSGYEQLLTGITVATIWKNGVPIRLTNGTFNANANNIVVSGTDVYAVGYEGNSIFPGLNRPVAKMWKNGVATSLTTGIFNATANSIVLVGSDIYIGGNEDVQQPNFQSDNFTSSSVKVWKNGVATTYTDGTTHAELYQMYYY